MDAVDHKTIPDSARKEKPENRPHYTRGMGKHRTNNATNNTPRDTHTAGTQEEGITPTISPDLQHIRNNAPLTQTISKHPQIYKWLTDDYTEKEVATTIQQLKNYKSHGQDGIHGETYKALNSCKTKPLAIILNKIKNRDKLPQNGPREQWYPYTKTRAMHTNAKTTDQYA